jgi:uncharacterized protein (TIGR00255 family)
MTAFASRTGALGPVGWAWEMRGVNARGLDLRLRLPEGSEGLEPLARAALTARFSRGNISLTLKLNRDDQATPLQLDPVQLDRVLAALDQVQDRALAMGVTLGQPNAADVLAQRGVVVQGKAEDDNTNLIKALQDDLDLLLEDFAAMRGAEGAALRAVLLDQLTQIDALTAAATQAAEARRGEVRANLTAALCRVIDAAPEIDETRVAQELALLAVKSDITEELDRLRAHVAAARALLDDPKPAGRKFDFLAQEFNREANTLCSKAGSAQLTAIGLDLKAVIDQMREQVQNVE